jgi:hypothetical protein
MSSIVPVYYVVMPFTGGANFNVSLYSKYKGARQHANYSIPACALYNGQAYVPCGKCNITSLTARNVTYGCFDISVLCSWISGASRRRLVSMSLDGDALHDDVPVYRRNGAGTTDVGGPMEEDDEGNGAVFGSFRVRSLRSGGVGGGGGSAGGGGGQKTDDLIAKNFNNRTDDGGGDDEPADDEFSNKYQTNIAQFSAIAVAIKGELETVLSLDFSKVDLAKAAPVIIFVSFLAGLIVVGTVFFLRWDKFDRHTMVYLRDYRIRLARLKVKKNLLNGGAGVVTAEESNVVEGLKVHEEINKALGALWTSFKPDEFFAGKRKLKVHIGADDALLSPHVSPAVKKAVPPPPTPELPLANAPFTLPALGGGGTGQKPRPLSDSLKSLASSSRSAKAREGSVTVYAAPASPTRLLPVSPTGSRASRNSVAVFAPPTSPTSFPVSPSGRNRVGSTFFAAPDGMFGSQTVASLFGRLPMASPSVSTKLDESIRGKKHKLEDLDLHEHVHGHNEHALQVLTADFGNVVLGSQASKQADSFGKGKRVITMREMSNIIMEEVQKNDLFPDQLRKSSFFHVCIVRSILLSSSSTT